MWPCLFLAAAASAPWFVDVTDALGLDFVHRHGAEGRKLLPETMGSGGCLLDANADGRLDLYLVQSGPIPRPGHTPGEQSANELWLRGPSGFTRAPDAGGAGDRGYGQGAVCADVDGDAATDIFVTNVGPNRWYFNDGHGRFSAGSEDPTSAWSTSAALADLDGDTDLDLYVVNYVEFDQSTHPECRRSRGPELFYCHPDVFAATADQVLLGSGGRTFSPAEPSLGFADPNGKGLGVVAFRAADGAPSLSVANDSTPNFLWRRESGRYLEVGLFEGVALNGEGRTEAGMGVDAGDVDGDGSTDLVVTNLSMETNTLYLSGAAGFRDATRAAGLHAPSLPMLGFGVALADLDIDGDLDLVVVNGDVLDNVHLLNDSLSWRQPGQIFLNDGAGRFTSLGPIETGAFGAPRVGRALLVGDLDNDGDPDLVVTENAGPTRVFENRAPRAGGWLGIELQGRAPNTGAVGAVVELLDVSPNQRREVRAGSGYLGSNDPRLLFALGAATSARVRITWPDGATEVTGPLAGGRYHRLSRLDAASPSAPSAPTPANDRPR